MTGEIDLEQWKETSQAVRFTFVAHKRKLFLIFNLRSTKLCHYWRYNVMIVFVESDSTIDPNDYRDLLSQSMHATFAESGIPVEETQTPQIESALASLSAGPGGFELQPGYGNFLAFTQSAKRVIEQVDIPLNACEVSLVRKQGKVVFQLQVDSAVDEVQRRKVVQTINSDHPLSPKNKHGLQLEVDFRGSLRIFREFDESYLAHLADKIEADFQLFANLDREIQDLILNSGNAEKEKEVLQELKPYLSASLQRRTEYHVKDNQAPLLEAFARRPLHTILLAVQQFLPQDKDVHFSDSDRIATVPFVHARPGTYLPSYHHHRFWERDLPLREAAVCIVGSQLLHEYTDDIIAALDRSFFTETGVPGASDHFEDLRCKGEAALNRLILDSKASEYKVLTHLENSPAVPWWKQRALLRSLKGSPSEEAGTLLQHVVDHPVKLVQRTVMSATKPIEPDDEFLTHTLKLSALYALTSNFPEKATTGFAQYMADVTFLTEETAINGWLTHGMFEGLLALPKEEGRPALAALVLMPEMHERLKMHGVRELLLQDFDDEVARLLMDCFVSDVSVANTLPGLQSLASETPLGSATTEFIDRLLVKLKGTPDQSEHCNEWKTKEFETLVAEPGKLLNELEVFGLNNENRYAQPALVMNRLLDIDIEQHGDIVAETLYKRISSFSQYGGTTGASDYREFISVIGKLFLAGKLPDHSFLEQAHIQTASLGNSRLPDMARMAIAYIVGELCKDNSPHIVEASPPIKVPPSF